MMDLICFPSYTLIQNVIKASFSKQRRKNDIFNGLKNQERSVTCYQFIYLCIGLQISLMLTVAYQYALITLQKQQLSLMSSMTNNNDYFQSNATFEFYYYQELLLRLFLLAINKLDQKSYHLNIDHKNHFIII